MALDVIIPQMGESVLEGTILEWKVKVGDKVVLNQPLVELMTDKINIEIPAEGAGTVLKLLAEVDDVVSVGARVAIIDDGTGPATDEVAAPASTPRRETVTEPATTPVQSAPAPAPATASVATTAPRGQGKSSPKVKMLLRQYSMSSDDVAPTGKAGLILVEDVMRAIESRSASSGFSSGTIPSPDLPTMPTIIPNANAGASGADGKPEPKYNVEIPKFAPLPANLRETKEPVAGVRKLISEHMTLSLNTSAHVTTFEDIDMTDLVAYRTAIKKDFIANYGANITYLPFIVKAVCNALKEYPKMNASMTDTEITYKNYYNIGIAVAKDEGLIVPVIKDADKKSIIELAFEIADLGNRARNNKLVPDEISGGTFSLTNAGVFGATSSTPIINQPQVAILGIHAIVKKPWVVNDEIVIRDICTFGCSFDHRLIDGHIAVQFLHRVHEFLADTNKLLLYLR